MTIKHHIILSTTITVVLIAVIACQQKNQASENKEQNKDASKVATVVEKSTKDAEKIATEEIKNAIDEGTAKFYEEINKVEVLSLSEVNKSDIKEAKLVIDIFEVNGGAYSNKIVNFNGLPIGLLPCSANPIKSWQTVFIRLSSEAISSISLTNSIGITDKTGDFYNLRNISLIVTLNDSCKLRTNVNTNTFSSVGDRWPYKQGKTVRFDGTPFTYIFIN